MSAVHVDFRKWPDQRHWQFTMTRLGEDEHATIGGALGWRLARALGGARGEAGLAHANELPILRRVAIASIWRRRAGQAHAVGRVRPAEDEAAPPAVMLPPEHVKGHAAPRRRAVRRLRV